MLKRVVLLFASAVALANAESLEQRLIGTWESVEYPPRLKQYLTYRPDHTCITSYADGTNPFRATWRVDGDELIETWSTGPWRGSIDKCKFSIRGDRLSFGLHRTIRKSHGGQLGKPEGWMSGVSYQRAK